MLRRQGCPASPLLDYRQIPAGHNQPSEAPAEVALAVRDLHAFLQLASRHR